MSYGELNSDALYSVQGLWHFNGDATDSSGNANDGAVTGATLINAGKFGAAYSFDGNDKITVTRAANLEPASISVSMWIKCSTIANYKYILSKWLSTTLASYCFTKSTTGIYFLIRVGAGYKVSNIILTAKAEDNAWHWIVGTYGDGYIRIFLDGREYGTSVAATGTIAYTTGDLFFGNLEGTQAFYFVGVLDEVCIWSRVLPAREIWELYAQMQGAYGVVML
jgi:hypothetical protein